MSEQVGPAAAEPVGDATNPTADQTTDQAANPTADAAVDHVARPGDPVERDLAQVAEAMAQARAGVPTVDGVPTVPDDDEVAGLERAHDALRTTLDRVERGG